MAGAANQYSRRQLRVMVRGARTADDHERLAAYFRARATEYATKAAWEDRVLADYVRDAGREPSKYPTRGDVARDLAAYYRAKANHAGALAAEQAREAEQLRTAK